MLTLGNILDLARRSGASSAWSFARNLERFAGGDRRRRFEAYTRAASTTSLLLPDASGETALDHLFAARSDPDGRWFRDNLVLPMVLWQAVTDGGSLASVASELRDVVPRLDRPTFDSLVHACFLSGDQLRDVACSWFDLGVDRAMDVLRNANNDTRSIVRKPPGQGGSMWQKESDVALALALLNASGGGVDLVLFLECWCASQWSSTDVAIDKQLQGFAKRVSSELTGSPPRLPVLPFPAMSGRTGEPEVTPAAGSRRGLVARWLPAVGLAVDRLFRPARPLLSFAAWRAKLARNDLLRTGTESPEFRRWYALACREPVLRPLLGHLTTMGAAPGSDSKPSMRRSEQRTSAILWLVANLPPIPGPWVRRLVMAIHATWKEKGCLPWPLLWRLANLLESEQIPEPPFRVWLGTVCLESMLGSDARDCSGVREALAALRDVERSRRPASKSRSLLDEALKAIDR